MHNIGVVLHQHHFVFTVTLKLFYFILFANVIADFFLILLVIMEMILLQTNHSLLTCIVQLLTRKPTKNPKAIFEDSTDENFLYLMNIVKLNSR